MNRPISLWSVGDILMLENDAGTKREPWRIERIWLSRFGGDVRLKVVSLQLSLPWSDGSPYCLVLTQQEVTSRCYGVVEHES